MSAQKKQADAAARERAANQRKAHVAALETERDGVKAALAGATDDAAKQRLEVRVKAIDAELKRVRSAPVGGAASAKQETRD